jgi:cellobiose phosphorylase
MKKRHHVSSNQGVYWPLLNQKGLKGYLTPFFAGHLAIDHDHYILEPTSEQSMYAQTTSRNVHVFVDGMRFDLNGLLPHQLDQSFEYETDHAYQIVSRDCLGVELKTTSFVALHEDVEIHLITLTNKTHLDKEVQLMSAVSIYGRSAENQRDHRHVTSLLNEIDLYQDHIIVTPRLHFDETGHHLNTRNYYVSFSSEDVKIKGIVPTLDAYINGGSYQYPRGLDNIKTSSKVSGYEAFGGIATETLTLKPNQIMTCVLLIGSAVSDKEAKDVIKTYKDVNKIHQAREETSAYFKYFNDHLAFYMQNEAVNARLNDVVLQPVYRRYMGNSYLVHHDYGKGGRGWRDLWQDMIALNMYGDPSVVSNMYQYFKGVRLDGTNATIIGEKPGEFKADRNKISRVWSDHGAWPLITLKMYMDETGDLSILLKKQPYFNDHLTHYGQKTRNSKGFNTFTTYEGTILEHILVQHITAIHHLGSHGFIKLLDADWNDGLDMGKDKGETIAFTMMYVHHLKVLVGIIEALNQKTHTLLKPLVDLILGTISLDTYFDQVNQEVVSVEINRDILNQHLMKTYDDSIQALRSKAFKNDVFRSYIGYDGLDLDNDDSVMLTGQAMALLNEIATKEQAEALSKKTKDVLYKKDLGGYQLNSLYPMEKHPLGRAFYFAYGHKENGAVFSHMVMMYVFGLYNYQLKTHAHEGLMTILNQSMNPLNQVYRGIPEYFNDQGQGKYLYLTGSASWLLYILRRHVFGLRFDFGKLYLEPQLDQSDFINDIASIETMMFNKKTTITYHLKQDIKSNRYNVLSIEADGVNISLPITTHYKNIKITLG